MSAPMKAASGRRIKLMSSGRQDGIEIAAAVVPGRRVPYTLRPTSTMASEAKTYSVIGVKCWVYRGDRLGHGEAPAAKPEGGDDDRRSRRGPRPGGPGGPGGFPGGPGGPRGRTDRAPRAGGAPVYGSDKPAEAGAAPRTDAPKPAVKRVRKAVAPAGGGDAKGE
jgi:small subunit ribosomal protein S3